MLELLVWFWTVSVLISRSLKLLFFYFDGTGMIHVYFLKLHFLGWNWMIHYEDALIQICGADTSHEIHLGTELACEMKLMESVAQCWHDLHIQTNSTLYQFRLMELCSRTEAVHLCSVRMIAQEKGKNTLAFVTEKCEILRLHWTKREIQIGKYS